MKREVASLQMRPSFPLPKGWAWTHVSALGIPDEQIVVTGPFGTNLGSADFVDEGTPVLTIGCLSDHGIRLEKAERVSLMKAAKLERYRLKEGDMLFSRMASVGRAGIVSAQLDGALYNYHIMRLRLNAQVIRVRLFAYFVRGSPTVAQYLYDVNHGATRDGINTAQLLSLGVTLPPVGEQDRIVAALDERLSELDASVAALARAERNLVRYRAAVLAAACSGTLVPTEADLARRAGRSYEPADQLLTRILTERRKANTKAKYAEPAQPDTSTLPKLPEGWVWATLDAIANEVRNGLGMPPHAEEGAPILRISAVRSGRVDTNEVRFLGIAPQGSEQYRLVPGDLLFTRYNGTKELVGVCGCVPDSGAGLYYPDKLIRVRLVSSGAISNYVMLAAGTGEAAKHIWSHLRTTAGQIGIAGQDIKGIPIPLPPLAEQERIVAEVDRHLTRADALAASIAQAKRRAQRLRRAILAAAFQGRLVPQDPNDEPASVLLERIRAQAASAEATTSAAPRRGRPPAPARMAVAAAAATGDAALPKRRGRPPGAKNKAKA